jgi:hypothetical protein
MMLLMTSPLKIRNLKKKLRTQNWIFRSFKTRSKLQHKRPFHRRPSAPIVGTFSFHLYLIYITKANGRLWSRFEQYVYENVSNEATQTQLDPACEHVPSWITAWIFTNCDVPDKQSGSRAYCLNKTFSQALKMRATISFHYNESGRGLDHWHQSMDRSWIGNPSLSLAVSRYMLSLQRRKVFNSHI